MKKIIPFLLLIVIAFTACDKDEPAIDKKDDVIEITIDEITFASDSEDSNKQTINFTTNKPWTATLSKTAPWVNYEPKNGDAGRASINITVEDNETYDDRSVTLTIKTGNVTKDVTIEQKQKDAILLGEDDYTVDTEGGTFDVVVQANVPIEVTIPDEINWVRLVESNTRGLEDRVLSFEVDENDTPEGREAEITITNVEKKISQTIVVTQAPGKVFEAEQTEYEIDYEGGMLEIKFQTNIEDFELIIDEEIDWIYQYQNANQQNSSMIDMVAPIVVDYNWDFTPRSAIISIVDPNSSHSLDITINQKEHIYFHPIDFDYYVEIEGGTIWLEHAVNTYMEIRLPIEHDWITFLEEEVLPGEGPEGFDLLRHKVKIEPHSGQRRQGYVCFDVPDSDMYSCLRIIQYGVEDYE